MEDRGYVVFKQWVDVPLMQFKRFQNQSRNATTIFNARKRNDELRRQVFVRKNGTAWMRRVTETLPLGSRTAGGCVLLSSLAGCESQMPHCDYVPTPSVLACTADTVPCGFLVALQDGTGLDVWPRSHKLVRGETTRNRVRFKRTRIFLDKGDAVLFRGDLIHAGCPYASNNIRLHFYFDHDSCRRIRNQTWLAPSSWKL